MSKEAPRGTSSECDSCVRERWLVWHFILFEEPNPTGSRPSDLIGIYKQHMKPQPPNTHKAPVKGGQGENTEAIEYGTGILIEEPKPTVSRRRGSPQPDLRRSLVQNQSVAYTKLQRDRDDSQASVRAVRVINLGTGTGIPGAQSFRLREST